MRALIAGGSGFAGAHLADACRAAGDDVAVVSRSGEHAADLRDAAAARGVVASFRPEVVYHLAAQAHVGRSWEDPSGTLNDNLTLALNVFDAVRAEAPSAVILFASSGEVYGPPSALPVTEAAPLRPQNPYAVSKAASDLLAGFYADAHGVRIVRARAFNHSGPGQDPMYAIASFTRQIAAGVAAGEDPVRIVTGNPATRRDYTDVRDVARAYRLLAELGEPGGAYNVCSGRTASAAELVAALGAAAGITVDHVTDPELIRAHEVMEVRGSYDKLRAATGWEPEIPLEQTLADSVSWWHERL